MQIEVRNKQGILLGYTHMTEEQWVHEEWKASGGKDTVSVIVDCDTLHTRTHADKD